MQKTPTIKRKSEWSAWRFIVWFGIVSLFADFVYEGARSITGPFMAHLGASAAFVGVITGLGEMLALAGRLVTGPIADKTRAYWPLAIGGYALTVISVPLLGATSALWLASLLIIAERAGKAVRSPGKDVMLSHATSAIGRGKGFSIHEALDQTGAVIGPLIVAAILASTSNNYHWAFAALAIPGLVAISVVLWLRNRVPDPSIYEAEEVQPREQPASNGSVSVCSYPKQYWWYLGFTVIATIGYGTFGVLSYHLVKQHVVAPSIVPIIYAGTMGAAALASLLSGWLYDRIGRRSLVIVPLLTAIIPFFAFQDTALAAIIGILIWGGVMGIQESTMRAAVADLIAARRRGTAYGVFAVGFGVASLVGGALTGFLYDKSVHALIVTVLIIETVALLVFLTALQKKLIPSNGKG